jgi:putative redox protein
MDMEVYVPGNKKVFAKFGDFLVETDQPVRAGGDASAPTPFELFLASIATCAGIFVLGFLQKRGLSTEGAGVSLHADRDPETHMVKAVSLQIKLPPDFPDKYNDAIIRAAEQCTVKRHLEDPPRFDTSITRG